MTGSPTLVATGNVETAQKVANAESTATAGAGLLNNMNTKQVIQTAVDFSLSAFGMAGEDCK